MPVIICIIIVMFLVLLGWTWSSLEDIEKTKKIEYIIVGFVVVYIITIIIYQISKIGISYENREIMTCAEIEELLEEVEKLLKDEIKEKSSIDFLEPDIEFCLYPKINLWDLGNYIYIKKGHEIQDIFIELSINLTDNNGVYTGQKYVMVFAREEIEKIVEYIKNVIKI